MRMKPTLPFPFRFVEKGLKKIQWSKIHEIHESFLARKFPRYTVCVSHMQDHAADQIE